ncbi:hypothetical protein ZPR_0154 [Zunongwangia profunda SM-A87]|uniref:Uncharacterized protein n=1 Tax=Zunongwangia profunda (strain DSM 18752 / CCTCC AB 206139 / SM-A87) TaxID=655815 RepID=D5BCK2_ZUNPS|nr:hypothetical protein [Zunongwangia profunda]ADF50515.1 hypothetical protein ZPR_0154 [Zunongwangia profunda SM-A87]
MSLKIHGLYIYIKNVNIASQPDVDAIVNAANAKLPPGSSMRFTNREINFRKTTNLKIKYSISIL